MALDIFEQEVRVGDWITFGGGKLEPEVLFLGKVVTVEPEGRGPWPPGLMVLAKSKGHMFSDKVYVTGQFLKVDLTKEQRRLFWILDEIPVAQEDQPCDPTPTKRA